ncbi:MAG TPA: 16S rRNA (cytidine(1402)-2'-O)-methyltransferase, partial [Thermoanaerobaculia bacterium]
DMTLAREMTKIHEEFLSGSISVVLAEVKQRGAVRGEITLVFAAALERKQEASPAEIAREFERLRDSGMRRNDAVKAVAERFGLRKNDVYKSLLGK